MKYYVITKQPHRTRQMSFEEMLNGNVTESDLDSFSPTGTITRWGMPSPRLYQQVFTRTHMSSLADFCAKYADMIATEDKSEYYEIFKIPKRKGGYRTICKPCPQLMTALRELKGILENICPYYYHTAAFAYIKGRCTRDAVQKHQMWNSNWFASFDFHDFFGSTTLDFVMRMLSKIFPFGYMMHVPNFSIVLKSALSLAFLNGGLPQGTPISPFITNLMMVPIDHRLDNILHKYENKLSKNGTDRFIYTRYADDILVSCRVQFDPKNIEKLILETLEGFHAPFSLNADKTHYQSKNGKNYHLGIILNQSNELSIGYKKKKRIKAALHNYLMDKQSGNEWSLSDIQELNGQISYFKSIEPKTAENMLNTFGEKFSVNVLDTLKKDLKNAA